MKKLILFFALISFTFAEEGNWGLAGNYTYFSGSARFLALGRTGTAITEDISSIYYNPAGLAYINPQQLVFSDAILPMGGRMGWFGYARPTREYGNFGIHFTGLYVGKIEITDIWGQRTGETFSDLNLLTSLDYARELFYNFGIGVSYKLLYHKISEWGGLGQGMDLGFLFFGNNTFSFGFSFQNVISPRLKLKEETERYPFSIKGGFAYRMYYDKFILLFDINSIPEFDILEFGGGMEYRPFRFLALRSGIDSKRFCFGFGIEYPMVGKTIGVDFAGTYHYASEVGYPMIFYFSLFMHFAGFRLEVTPRTFVFSPTSRENNVLPIRIFVNTKKEIERYQFVVKDDKGEVIRIYKDFGAPPREIVWDGRDDFGHLARDGKYYYECIVIERKGSVFKEDGFLAEIRTIGPAGEIFFKEKVPAKPKEELKEKEIPEEKPPEESPKEQGEGK